MKSLAIIEDNPDSQLLFELVLKPHFNVTVYDAGLPALEALMSDPPDVILLDIDLPDISGEEVFQRLRKDERFAAVPIIAVTAHSRPGFDDYIAKPIIDLQAFVRHIKGSLP